MYPPSATDANVYWGEANGSVALFPGPYDSVYQLQAPGAGVTVTSVSVADNYILWGECLAEGCKVEGYDNGNIVSVPTSGPPVDVQGDAGAWYWGDSDLEKFTLYAAAIPPHGFSLTAEGNVVAQLRKPRTLVLLVYATPKASAQHLNLLARVALGRQHAGLSRIAWGLRVRGHRLGAGDYLAELEAWIDGALTTGGPIVQFDVEQRGKLAIVAQSAEPAEAIPARHHICMATWSAHHPVGLTPGLTDASATLVAAGPRRRARASVDIVDAPPYCAAVSRRGRGCQRPAGPAVELHDPAQVEADSASADLSQAVAVFHHRSQCARAKGGGAETRSIGGSVSCRSEALGFPVMGLEQGTRARTARNTAEAFASLRAAGSSVRDEQRTQPGLPGESVHRARAAFDRFGQGAGTESARAADG